MEKIETPEGPSAIPLIGSGYCSPQHAAVYRRKCRHNRCKSLGDIVLSKLGGMLRAWFFSQCASRPEAPNQSGRAPECLMILSYLRISALKNASNCPTP